MKETEKKVNITDRIKELAREHRAKTVPKKDVYRLLKRFAKTLTP